MSLSPVIGYVTNSNYNKFFDFQLINIALIASILVGVALCKLPKLNNIFTKSFVSGTAQSEFKWGISLSIAFSIISVTFSLGGPSMLIPCLAAWFVVLKFKSDEYDKIIKCLLYIFLLNKIISMGVAAPVLLFIVSITTLCFIFTSAKNFSVLAVVLLIRPFYPGDFIIIDAFHAAEKFVALTYLREIFDPFPNIGYLEELLPAAICSAFKIIGFPISLPNSILTIQFLLLILSFYIVSTMNVTYAIALILLPIDRISLLFVFAYSIIYIYYFKKLNSNDSSKISLLVFCLFYALAAPIFMLLSPVYVLPLIFILTVGFLEFSWQKKIVLFFVLISSIFLLAKYLSFYLSIYSDFSNGNILTMSTPLSVIPSSDLVKQIIFFVFSIVLSVCSFGNKYKSKLKFLLILGFFTIICYIYSGYAFGRVDPGPGRVYPVLFLLTILIFIFFDAEIKSKYYVYLGLSALFYQTFAIFPLGSVKLGPDSDSIEFKKNYIETADTINSILNGVPVINYSNAPAITNLLDNSKLPPFTSPFVTVGRLSQELTIRFFEKNPDSAIYIGKNFGTFDSNDVRSRSPYVFRYLYENYNMYMIDGEIFAKRGELNNYKPVRNVLFADFDLQKSVLFYNSYIDRFEQDEFNVVTLDCANYEIGKYWIKSSGTAFLADLGCGNNYIPKVFLMGDFLAIQHH